MIALIDCDIITYSVGFASQKNTYTVLGKEFSKKTEASAYVKQCNLSPDQVKCSTVPDPVHFCLNAVKQLLESILKNIAANEYRAFITGEGNFREGVAKTKKYKGNRDPLHKPIHYKAIKEYLINVWQAEIISGMEADDALGITQYESFSKGLLDTTICSLDKDLLMIPGYNYNWRTRVKKYITPEEADKHFFHMMLTGDTADNVQGVPKVGKMTATKILDGCSSKEEMWEKVVETYYLGYYNHGKHSSIEEFLSTIDSIINEHVGLLWMRRENTSKLPWII